MTPVQLTKTIEPQTVFSITSNELMQAITTELDTSSMTSHELREVFCIVRKNLKQINWQELVRYSINHLPYGLSQTGIAWDGDYPCCGCPDQFVDGGRCVNEEQCKAWEIYACR